MSNFKQFEKDLIIFTKKTTGNLEERREAILLQFFSKIIDDTPIKDGFLRNSWTTTVGTPAIGDIQREANKNGTDSKRGIKLGRIGDTVYFENRLPYAKRIEERGAFMVKRNISKFKKYLK